jgi:hypothetical protein
MMAVGMMVAVILGDVDVVHAGMLNNNENNNNSVKWSDLIALAGVIVAILIR